MPSEPDQSGDLQFDAAERTGDAPAGATCVQCKRIVAGEYYEAAGRIVCGSCKRLIESEEASRAESGSFLRALVFGLGGAAGGAALWYGVRAATGGWEIGLIAIVVGFMVGYTVRAGGGAAGGRKYQILAVVLTYLAIGTTYIPYVMRSTPAASDLVAMLWLAIVMPVYAGLAGLPMSLISLLITAFALHQAWRMTAETRIVFTGPYQVGGTPPAAMQTNA